MCTGTGLALPFWSTKMMPLPPAATLVPPAADVCPHGEAAEAEDAAGEDDVAAGDDALLCERCLPLNAPVGRKLSAATGTMSALCAVCTPIEAFAVIPGSSLFCGLSTSVMTVYVTTFDTVVGFSRTCETTPLNDWFVG